MDRINVALQKYDYSLTNDIARQRVQEILDKDFKNNDNLSVYRQIVGLVDLTSLKSQDNDDSIEQIVEKLNAFDDKFEILPHPAAICVYPSFVQTVKSTLTEDLEIAAVAGGFPHSNTFTEVKIAEISLAVADGATEIDVVLPVGKMLAHQYDEVFEELLEIKDACRDAHLKVILETSLLQDAEMIKEAAVIAMVAGADFIKTSTGKDGQCATLEAVYLMCDAIKEFNKINDTRVGIKVAGGVSTTSDAVKYYTVVKNMLGEEWICPELFRFGASRLVNSLLSSIDGSEVKYF